MLEISYINLIEGGETGGNPIYTEPPRLKTRDPSRNKWKMT